MKSFWATFIDIWRFFSGHTALKLWSCDVRNVFLFVICSHPSYAGFLSQHLLQIHAKRFANVMLIFKSKEGTRKLYFAKWGETNESKISDGA